MPENDKYNARRHDILVQAVREGNYRGTAARLAGVHPTTLNAWLRSGELASFEETSYDSPEGKYRKLYEDMEEAEAQFEADMVGRVKRAAMDEDPRNWTAAMTILERTRPAKFGRRDTTVVEGGEKPIQTVAVHVLANPEAQDAANNFLRQLTQQSKPKELEASKEPVHGLPGLEDIEDAEYSVVDDE